MDSKTALKAFIIFLILFLDVVLQGCILIVCLNSAVVLPQLVLLKLGLSIVTWVSFKLIFIFKALIHTTFIFIDKAIYALYVIGLTRQLVVPAMGVPRVQFILVVLLLPLLFLKNTLELRISKLHQLESFSVLVTDIFAVLEAFKVELEVQHFFVIFIIIEPDNWHAIIELEGE